jgi:hypothetical protein
VNTANTTNAPHCSIWDYVDNQWHELENVTLKSYDIPEAWRYVGPNGELLLNVDGNSGYIEVTDSHFTLVVKP